MLGGAHQGGCLVVVHLFDDAQLQGLALGIGQGVQSLGQLGRLDRSVDLGLDLSQLIGVVVELDTELPTGREFNPSAAMVSAYQVAGDPVQPAAR
jgi:hypothetical protein